MSALVRNIAHHLGRAYAWEMDRVARNPGLRQERLLRRLLKVNANTVYGKKHGYSVIRSASDYAHRVPVVTYDDIEPLVDRMRNGERNVLTADQPIMFCTTSGTGRSLKYIPVTRPAQRHVARMMHQWLYRVRVDHPSCLNGAALNIAGSAVEGHAPCGIPYGCATGAIYRGLPQIPRGGWVLPYGISEIKDYDRRYYVMSRLALARFVTLAATPNPATLVRLAETGIQNQESIIRGIHDGTLGFSDVTLESLLAPYLNRDPNRARFLESVIERHGKLQPSASWPELCVVGCWLGGSAGYQADKLKAYYGDEVAYRDVGYIASEAAMSLPIQDGTAAGVLAVQNNYYEFVPFGMSREHAVTATGLETGKLYRILLTTCGGLYRYDIDDLVRVVGFYSQTPMIEFVRRGEDTLNITGEKLHANQVLDVMSEINRTYGIGIAQFRFVPNMDKRRYEIYLQAGTQPDRRLVERTVLPALDRRLSEINPEYQSKRLSRRLQPPCLHVMREGWVEAVRRQASRDSQFKWKVMAEMPHVQDHGFVSDTIEEPICTRH